MEQDEKNHLARLGYCVAASCVIPDMFQGWNGLDPMTGSYETEDQAWDGLGKSIVGAAGLMHDRVHKDVGRSRISRTARNKCGPKCSCTPGGGYGCACPGCEGDKEGEQ